jgi:hypothetical protein
MPVPDKKGRKEFNETNLVSVFSVFLLICLCFSVAFCFMSPASATDDKDRLSIIAENKDKLSIILINGEEIYLRSGYSHNFSQDYQLYIKGTDTECKRVWIELSRNGVSLQDGIVTKGSQFVYSQNSTEILNLTVDTIYEGADGVLVKFFPVYQFLDPMLPMPQTPSESLDNAFNNISSADPELETQAKGFDIPLLLLGLGTVLMATGFFAGKGKKK